VADKAAVDEQCLLVKQIALARRQRHRESLHRASVKHDLCVPLPRFYGDGESLRVSVREGQGVADLRAALIHFAMHTRFYREPILPSALKLKERLNQVGLSISFVHLSRLACSCVYRGLHVSAFIQACMFLRLSRLACSCAYRGSHVAALIEACMFLRLSRLACSCAYRGLHVPALIESCMFLVPSRHFGMFACCSKPCTLAQAQAQCWPDHDMP
jgi:hypothetical protein